jgi:Tol biopolymer transport system component
MAAVDRKTFTKDAELDSLILVLPLGGGGGGAGDGGGAGVVGADVSDTGEPGDGVNLSPSISGPPYRVVFASSSTNLVPGDTNKFNDVFVRDLVPETTRRVSVASNGAQAEGGPSDAARISADGGSVVFASIATNLVDGDTNGLADVFVHDLAAGETTRVSVASDGTQANGNSFAGAISGDGRLVVFPSDATNLVEGDTNEAFDVFVHEIATGRVGRVLRQDGSQPAGFVIGLQISSDGLRLLFTTGDPLVPEDTNGFPDLYVVPNPLVP